MIDRPPAADRAHSVLDRRWLRRVALSLALALGAGIVTFLIARGISGALLFIEQQELLSATGAAMSGGIEGLPAADLRAARLRAEQSAESHLRFGLLLAFGVTALAAAGSYLWFESHAEIASNDHQPNR